MQAAGQEGQQPHTHPLSASTAWHVEVRSSRVEDASAGLSLELKGSVLALLQPRSFSEAPAAPSSCLPPLVGLYLTCHVVIDAGT